MVLLVVAEALDVALEARTRLLEAPYPQLSVYVLQAPHGILHEIVVGYVVYDALRERLLQGEPFYLHMREDLYPRLRTVRFDFHLHRRGMLKDTVHTTELDTAYMRGVQLIRDREYEKALSILKDYRDYNTAVAYLSMDYNASAKAILDLLPRSPQTDYMMAILSARAGDDQKAVQYYMDACRADRSLVFRGNLDPEIYVLIQRYGLNREDEALDDLL